MTTAESDEISHLQEVTQKSESAEMNGNSNGNHSLWHKILFLGIGLTLYTGQGINDFMLTPLFPLVGPKKGVNKTEIGLVMGIFDVSNLIFSFLLPPLVGPDTKKVFFCCGGLISGLAMIIMGLSNYITHPTAFFFFSMAARIIMGMGAAMVWSAGLALLVPFAAKNEGKLTSLIQSSVLVGVLVGPVVGGSLYNLWGYMCPFMVAGVGELVVSILSLLLIPSITDSLDNGIEKEVVSWKQYVRFLSNPGLIVLSLPILVNSAGGSLLALGLPNYLTKTIGIDEGWVSYIYLCAGVGAMFSPIAGFFTDRGYAGYCIVVVGVFAPIAYFMFVLPAVFSNFESIIYVVVNFCFLCSIFISAMVPFFSIFQVMASQNGARNISFARVIAAAWITVCLAVGRVAGSIVLGGVMLEIFSFYKCLAFQAILVCVSSIMCIAYMFWKRLHRKMIITADGFSYSEIK